MSEKNKFYMQKAIALAKKAKTTGNGTFGAVIVKNDAIVAQAHNTVSRQQDFTQHAELLAIQEACRVLKTKDLSGCVLYTSCEPCMMCLGACHWAKFKTIYYGASAQDAKEYGYRYSKMFYASNAQDRHEEFHMLQLLRDEAVAVWKQ